MQILFTIITGYRSLKIFAIGGYDGVVGKIIIRGRSLMGGIVGDRVVP